MTDITPIELANPVRELIRGDLSVTGRAYVDEISSTSAAAWLEKRLLAVRVALWAKPMRWFGAACVWLQHVSHGPFPDAFKFVFLLLSTPCFEASQFCFKRAYAIQLRRLRLAGLNGLFESLKNEAVKLDGFGSKRLSVAQTYCRLRET